MMKIFNTRLSDLSDMQQAQLAKQQQTDDYLLLDFDTRQHSRFKAATVSGESVGVDLPRTGTLKGNDVLINEAGELIQVIAKPQAVTKVTADDVFTLMKGAYHLGNRHVPLMFDHSIDGGVDAGDAGYALYFENDHVLAQMLERLGLQVAEASVPFEPETGAYQSGHGHSHSHSHTHSNSDLDGHEHNHEHGHSHSHTHGTSNSHEHVGH